MTPPTDITTPTPSTESYDVTESIFALVDQHSSDLGLPKLSAAIKAKLISAPDRNEFLTKEGFDVRICAARRKRYSRL